jgi:phosphatidylglycerophosphatase A
MSMPEQIAAPSDLRSWRRIPIVPRLVATAGGVGFLRPAPGTWGSLLASSLGYAWLVSAPVAWITPGLALGMLVATVSGVWASGRCTAITGIEDPSQVVIDEVAGVWATLLIIPPVVAVASPLITSILGFLLFRLFDIVKPWPISALERFPRGWGVMADDLGAGVLAGILAGALLH